MFYRYLKIFFVVSIYFSIEFVKNWLKVETKNLKSSFINIYAHIYILIYDLYNYISLAATADSGFEENFKLNIIDKVTFLLLYISTAISTLLI